MFRKILAAVDGSTRAKGVFAAALELAERFDAAVHLYRAIDLPAEFPAAAANVSDGLEPYLLGQASESLARLAANHPRVTIEPPSSLRGSPGRDILAKAKLLEVDLIVIGSHGYGGWDRVLGTTAGKVVNQAKCNVLVVHDSSS